MNKKILFRGKSVDFWFDHIFSELIRKVRENEKNDIIFDKEKFLEIDENGLAGLIDAVEQFSKGTITLHGFPFFIFEKKSVIANSSASSCLEQLRTVNPSTLDIIDLNSRYRIYNTETDLSEIEKLVKKFQILYYRKRGVNFLDYSSFYIEGLPDIGKGTNISSGDVILGNSRIGENVKIFPNTFIENSEIGDNCEILPGSVIRDSHLRGGNKIGPYSHLRMNSLIETGANVGNFVEMKKSKFGTGSKAMHLSYIGDASIGNSVNIGAGTITCNYDGEKKHQTRIEDNAFIGSGTELVAPVKVGKNSYVAAGSTITEDIENDSLGVARERQRNIRDWAKRKRKKKS